MTTAGAVASGLSGLIGGFYMARLPRQLHLSRREGLLLAARLIVAAAIVFFAVYTQVTMSRQTECYRGYFTQVSASLADRSAASGQSTAAQLRYLDTVAEGASTAAARAEYIDALRHLDAERRASPIPQPPDCR